MRSKPYTNMYSMAWAYKYHMYLYAGVWLPHLFNIFYYTILQVYNLSCFWHLSTDFLYSLVILSWHKIFIRKQQKDYPEEKNTVQLCTTVWLNNYDVQLYAYRLFNRFFSF